MLSFGEWQEQMILDSCGLNLEGIGLVWGCCPFSFPLLFSFEFLFFLFYVPSPLLLLSRAVCILVYLRPFLSS
jgi:hypothetical protein